MPQLDMGVNSFAALNDEEKLAVAKRSVEPERTVLLRHLRATFVAQGAVVLALAANDAIGEDTLGEPFTPQQLAALCELAIRKGDVTSAKRIAQLREHSLDPYYEVPELMYNAFVRDGNFSALDQLVQNDPERYVVVKKICWIAIQNGKYEAATHATRLLSDSDRSRELDALRAMLLSECDVKNLDIVLQELGSPLSQADAEFAIHRAANSLSEDDVLKNASAFAIKYRLLLDDEVVAELCEALIKNKLDDEAAELFTMLSADAWVKHCIKYGRIKFADLGRSLTKKETSRLFTQATKRGRYDDAFVAAMRLSPKERIRKLKTLLRQCLKSYVYWETCEEVITELALHITKDEFVQLLRANSSSDVGGMLLQVFSLTFKDETD